MALCVRILSLKIIDMNHLSAEKLAQVQVADPNYQKRDDKVVRSFGAASEVRCGATAAVRKTRTSVA